MPYMVITKKYLKHLVAVSCCIGLLTACQLFSTSQFLSGALSVAVQFPESQSFRIQALAPETRAIYVMVYGAGLSLEKPLFWGPLTRFNPRMVIQGVPVGSQQVVVAAYNAQSELISAAQERVIVRAGVRSTVTAELQPNPDVHLPPEVLQALARFQPQIPAEPCGFSSQGLQVAVQFPHFRTHLIKPQTRWIYLVIYGTGLSLDNPAVYGPISPENPRITAQNLPIGRQIVLTVAVDEQGAFLTGARQEVEIQPQQRIQLTQELQEDFVSTLNEREIHLLERLTLSQLQKQAELTAELSPPVCPTPSPAQPSPQVVQSAPVPKPNFSKAPEPLPEPVPEPTAEPSAQPSPVPSASPSESLPSSGGGGGGGGGAPIPSPTPTGASLNIEVIVNNGDEGLPPIEVLP